MAYYARGAEVRQIDAQLFAAWVSANNPKATGWTLIADPPSARHSWDGSAWVGPALATLKAERIAQINAECTQRILAVWPLEKQMSALAGIYGAEQTTAMTDWVDAHIAASDTASDSVDAATTQQQIEAVTVTWPV